MRGDNILAFTHHPVRKRVLLRHLHTNMITLPRQARDKHSTRTFEKRERRLFSSHQEYCFDPWILEQMMVWENSNTPFFVCFVASIFRKV
jgi:hypothetical protein